jgi:hypothetical protein
MIAWRLIGEPGWETLLNLLRIPAFVQLTYSAMSAV